MIQIRRLLPLMAISLICTAFLVLPNQCNADFRVIVNGTGGATQYYFQSGNSATFSGITIGNFSTTIQTDNTNFPGGTTIGTLSQTIIIGQTTDGGGTLSVEVDVIASGSGLLNGQQTTAANIATLTGAALATFTSPKGNPLLATSDVSAAVNATITAGSVQNTTVASGVTSATVLSDNVSLTGSGAHTVQSKTFDGTGGYTLTDTVVISGINGGVSGGTFTGTAGVNAVPAPAGMVLLLSGVPVLIAGGLRRRNAKAQPK